MKPVASHLGEFEQLILFALLRLRDDAYGVTVRQEIEARTGRSVTAGAIYTALGRLEARGFVSSRVGDPTALRGGRRRKYYRPTAVGAAMLQRSYDQLHAMADGMLEELHQAAPAADPPVES